MVVDGERLPMRVADLPCVVETHKTVDNVCYFKTGDVGQAILVGMSAKKEQKVMDGNRMANGITPAFVEPRKRIWSDKEIVGGLLSVISVDKTSLLMCSVRFH